MGLEPHDRLDHNQELYQLSYAHRGSAQSTIAATAGLDQRHDRSVR